MGNLKEKEFTSGMIKSVKYIVQPSGRFVIGRGGEMMLFSVFLGHLHSTGFLFIGAKRYSFGLSCPIKCEAILFTEIGQKDLM